MKKFLYIFFFAALICGAFLAGASYTNREGANGNPAAVKPAAANPNLGRESEAGTDISSLPPGTVRITPDKQQMVGVRTGAVEKAAVEHSIRTVGRVRPTKSEFTAS